MLRQWLEARCVRVAGLRRARILIALVLTMAVFAVAAGLARAEGSGQLYPANATCAANSAGGSCRANIEWRTDAYGPASGAQVRRRSYMQVYANAGEVLAMGSSAVAVAGGDILVYNPGVVTDSNAEPLPALVTGVNGFRCSDQRAASGIAAQGRITSRAQELAGSRRRSTGAAIWRATSPARTSPRPRGSTASPSTALRATARPSTAAPPPTST